MTALRGLLYTIVLTFALRSTLVRAYFDGARFLAIGLVPVSPMQH